MLFVRQPLSSSVLVMQRPAAKSNWDLDAREVLGRAFKAAAIHPFIAEASADRGNDWQDRDAGVLMPGEFAQKLPFESESNASRNC